MTVSVTYTKITTYYTVSFVADGETVKTISVGEEKFLLGTCFPKTDVIQ